MEFATFIFAEEGGAVDECSVSGGVFDEHFHFYWVIFVIVGYSAVGLVRKVEKTVHTTMTIGYHCMDVIMCFSFLFFLLPLLLGEIVCIDWYWIV